MKKLILIFCLTICSSILFAQETERAQKVRTRSNTPNEKAASINIGNNTMPNRISMNVTVGKQTIKVNAIEGGAIVLFPDKTGLKINSAERTITEMTSAEYRISNTPTVSKQTQGTSFGDRVNAGLGQGGGIVSAAVSSVSNKVSGIHANPNTVKLADDETDIVLAEPLEKGQYQLTFTLAEKGKSSKVTIDFSVEKGKIISQFKGAGSPKSAGF